MILNDHDQKEVILSYEKDYGSLVMAYNKLGKQKNSVAFNMLRMKAESLRQEIIQEISPRKNHFNDINLEVATSIARSIDNFINYNIEGDQNIVTLGFVTTPKITTLHQNQLRAGSAS